MFRIGDFSKLARVSIKALRHYDDEGLLAPAHVDARTGYRYYAAAQLETLQRILLLKELGFALADVRALLAAPEATLRERLAERRRELERDISRDLARMRYIDALSQQQGSGARITLSQVPAIAVHAVRGNVPRAGKAIEAMFEEAERRVARARQRAEGSPFLLFHDAEHREHELDVEVCIPVRDAGACAFDCRVVPEARAACVTYRGGYEQTWPIYADMLRWLEQARCRMTGPLREVYHRFGAGQSGYRLPEHVLAESSEGYVTELVVPVGEPT